MNRRTFLTAVKSKNIQHKQSFAHTATTSGLQNYTGPWTFNEVSHLIRRTMFGAKKSDIDHFLTLQPVQAIDELLNNIPTVTPPLRDYGTVELEMGSYNDIAVPIGQSWVNDLTKITNPDANRAVNRLRFDTIRKWWVGLMLNQNRSINEKMILFWHHHFSIQKEEVENAMMIYRHHQLLRTNVLGNVRQLTIDVSRDPAMLMHLNGYLNSKLAPDENYARELQELFTIGKGNLSLYTEEDVIAASRVLTGWRIDNDSLLSYVDTASHDTGNKTFSSFYNNTTIAGSTDAQQELNQLIHMIFATEECSRFICRKIYKWFVYSHIDTNTENNVIAPLATILRQNNFEIKPVLHALFNSEHFFDPAIMACYIKNPYDFVVGTLREFEVVVPPYTNYTSGYPMFQNLYEQAALMQQDLFQPPDVSGWPAYHQEPMYYELWVNSNSLPRRAEFTDSLISDGIIDVNAFAGRCADPADPDALVSEVAQLLLRYPLSENARSYIKNRFLLNNTGNDAVWSNAWTTNNSAVTVPALQQMFAFILNLPEFHLC